MEIHNFFNRIGKPELGVTKSALTQQRKNLNPQVFIAMNKMLVQAIYKEEKIKAIENTKLIPVGIESSVFEIPNTKKMKEVYFKRWNIEKSYDVIKNKLEVENFSGYSEIAIKQDFYAQILLFNIIEDIKNTANREIQKEREKSMKTYKYEYIVNLNILISICKQYLILLSVLGNDERSDEIQDKMLGIIKRNLIAIKSGKKKKRKWNINNKYRTNMRRN